MRTGMLWFDNSSRPLAERVKPAADYYQKKYGTRPNVCFVHPSMMPEGNRLAGVEGIEMRRSRQVLPNHLWMGFEEKDNEQ